MLFCASQIQAQNNDRQALLDFLVPLQALTDTDEGSLKDNEYRLRKLSFYNNPETAFVALPSSVSASVECIEGNCITGEGTVKYPTLNASYTGTFQDGYPHERGQITNVNGIHMIVTHYKGLLSGPAALQLVDDELRDYLYLEYSTGDMAKVTNYYFPQFKLYYEGTIDDFKPYREGKLYGRGIEARTIFDESGEIKSGIGKMNYNEDCYFEGKLQWKDGDFTFLERGTLYNDQDGYKIDMTFLSNGKPRLQQMSIWKGDTLYVGPVDEQFQPHGERGRLAINKRTVKEGVWEHGIYQGRNGRQAERSVTFSNRSEQGRNNRSFMIKAVKDKLGINGFSKYTLYEGSPSGNTFTIKADAMNHRYLGIWVINFSNNRQKVCIKPQFSGSSSRKECYDMYPLAKRSEGENIDFQDKGIASFPINLPSDEGTFRFNITEGNGRDVYILVFPR